MVLSCPIVRAQLAGRQGAFTAQGLRIHWAAPVGATSAVVSTVSVDTRDDRVPCIEVWANFALSASMELCLAHIVCTAARWLDVLY